jgi:peroxiredoxin
MVWFLSPIRIANPHRCNAVESEEDDARDVNRRFTHRIAGSTVTRAAFFRVILLAMATMPLRSGDGAELPPVVLQMLRNDSVFAELRLSDDDIKRVQGVVDRVDGDWWRSRIMQDVERIATIDELTRQLKTELKTILSPESYERLEQLERQALGTRMFLLPSVADKLGLSPVTVDKIAKIADQTDASVRDLAKQSQDGGTADEIEQKRKTLVEQERTSIVGLLTTGQKERISTLTGEPFNFTSVTRTLPRAPELQSSPEQWLQGKPTTLAELRGRVVIVHFYAFQCINCQRNLPHYAAWHRDYADKGLTVIGIQTPETPAERDVAKVAAAITQEGIEYPVLMDADSINWQEWGTTMWPSVYLIDRDGYLRTWWQGELNWQGNPGEQKMRAQIEQLLK